MELLAPPLLERHVEPRGEPDRREALADLGARVRRSEREAPDRAEEGAVLEVARPVGAVGARDLDVSQEDPVPEAPPNPHTPRLERRECSGSRVVVAADRRVGDSVEPVREVVPVGLPEAHDLLGHRLALERVAEGARPERARHVHLVVAELDPEPDRERVAVGSRLARLGAAAGVARLEDEARVAREEPLVRDASGAVEAPGVAAHLDREDARRRHGAADLRVVEPGGRSEFPVDQERAGRRAAREGERDEDGPGEVHARRSPSRTQGE